MGELSKLETRTPIEIALDIDSDGMTTARKLYAFLELHHSIMQGGLNPISLETNLP